MMTSETNADKGMNRAPRVAILSTLFFLLILVIRWEILTEPPYWDASMGLWSEADVIREKQFDLYQQWLVEPGWKSGGDSAYRFSLLPVLIAGLMTVLPTPTATFVTYHLITFLFAGMIAGLFGELVVRRFGWPTGILSTFALLTSPVLCTQIDMLAMEIPIALISVLALRSVDERHFLRSAGILTFGLLFKVTVMVLLMAHLCLLSLLLVSRPSLEDRQSIGRGILTTILGLSLAGLIIIQDVGGMAGFMPAVLILMALWVPDLMMLASVGIVGSLVWFIWPRGRAGAPTTIFDRISAEPSWVFAVLATMGTLASYVVITGVPRYLTFVTPLIFWSALLLFSVTPWLRMLRLPVVLSLISFHLLNWNGQLYPSGDFLAEIMHQRKTDACRREGSLLERTHAYLADHRDNQKAIRAFEEVWDSREPVFVSLPFADFITRPALGYVRRPIDGYLTGGFHRKRGGLKDVAFALKDRPRSAWFLYSRNIFAQHLARFYIPPPPGQPEGPIDEPVLFYRRNFSESDLALMTKNFYFEHTGPHPEHLKHYPAIFSDRDTILKDALQRIGQQDLWKYYERKVNDRSIEPLNRK
jgi:hypothetical protein